MTEHELVRVLDVLREGFARVELSIKHAAEEVADRLVPPDAVDATSLALELRMLVRELAERARRRTP